MQANNKQEKGKIKKVTMANMNIIAPQVKLEDKNMQIVIRVINTKSNPTNVHQKQLKHIYIYPNSRLKQSQIIKKENKRGPDLLK